jgi:hypothetical protein
MAEAGPGEAGGYVAFISYSHKDAAIGRWLHRKLEGYRLPKRLAGTQGEDGEVPARLTPIFRDRDELPAAGDLSEKVRAALAVSRNLVVVCSPHSAVSPWVTKEIITFREIHPERPIFTAIVEGDPDQCFAPALREGNIEPLAADLRKEGDGHRLGLLKLVAGLSGVGLDALVQRDAARRIRRVTYVTAAAVAAMLIMALLTAFALNARAEAQRQRAQAEGLVEFMFTDLRDKLREVGRLDVLEPVNERALAYYASQGDVADLPDFSQARRAGILQALGEDDERRGDIDGATARLTEAYAATARVVGRHPRQPDALYYHAQSEYWLGYLAYLKEDWPRARKHWGNYAALAVHLVEAQPNDPTSYRELGYSRGNLCTLGLAVGSAPQPTLRTCLASLAAMQKVREMKPGDDAVLGAVANRHAWAGKAWLGVGNVERAQASFGTYLSILESLARKSPDNAEIQDQLMRALMTTAEYMIDHGHRRESAPYAERARLLADRLTRLDPTNQRWRKWQRRIDGIIIDD